MVCALWRRHGVFRFFPCDFAWRQFPFRSSARSLRGSHFSIKMRLQNCTARDWLFYDLDRHIFQVAESERCGNIASGSRGWEPVEVNRNNNHPLKGNA
jgi:hypothetical protein